MSRVMRKMSFCSQTRKAAVGFPSRLAEARPSIRVSSPKYNCKVHGVSRLISSRNLQGLGRLFCVRYTYLESRGDLTLKGS